MSEKQPLPSGDFRIFVQKIAMQGFFELGLIEIPGAPKKYPDAKMAAGVVDDLQMLLDKCAGNLDQAETMTITKYIDDINAKIADLG
ncbi:MAG: DUF1844 domain-containing protein [Planctomycetota bacterium]|jgi:hypothetical protein|nr:DUF1844 domain-containing protein [Planctomycetota bacterium]